MLAITRKPLQTFIITTTSGETITIKIIRSCESKVIVGIDAPKSVHIDREEVYEKYKAIREVLKEQGTLV